MSRSARARAALLLIVAFGLASFVQGVSIVPEIASRASVPASDRVAARAVIYDERFAHLREPFAPGYVLGYVTTEQDGDLFTAPIALQEFFLAQYALAPVILLKGTRPPYVLGNFPDTVAFASDPRPLRYARELGVVRDLGVGVVLFGGGER